jgi:hypothetical protein
MAKEELREELKIEIGNLERLNGEMKQLLTKISNKPSFIEVRAAGSILHDFYCGVERIFERIALSVDKNLPKGDNWHTELLLQMAKPFEKIRDEIIAKELLQNLKEYLRFRHLFKHIYGFELKWGQFREHCIKLEDILKELKREVENFMK